ncbi:MAG: hypothetical protein ABIA21_02585 [Candidatus Aenigmatarchaeota archaeon]
MVIHISASRHCNKVHVRSLAYSLAESDGFQKTPLDYWVDAENEILGSGDYSCISELRFRNVHGPSSDEEEVIFLNEKSVLEIPEKLADLYGINDKKHWANEYVLKTCEILSRLGNLKKTMLIYEKASA